MMWSARLPVDADGDELPHAAIRSASDSVAPAARPYFSNDRRVTAASDQYRGPCPIEVLLLYSENPGGGSEIPARLVPQAGTQFRSGSLARPLRTVKAS